ncbi:MAG: glycolate oxidase subunit GlcE [Methyloceanibacter sp.]|uniref:glycolate oxidase subunit GlcE n=1 Tax=Methyloceanibacter sp. TaxID=1965321 RepID=UPI003D6D52F6
MTVHMRLGFHAPETGAELAGLVAEAADTRTPLEVMGRGTKREVGLPVGSGAVVSTENMVGVALYEPTELALVVQAGTTIGQIEALLAENDQELPFEPVDLGPVLGYGPGEATIGGVIATNLSGSRRILKGSARDHVLGVHAVNGRGEQIKAGGRVMKNVTGYDLGRALAGSWGTLAIMTEISLKVLPAQREARTVVFFGLTDQTAVEALCIAMGTPFEVSGTVHMHAELAAHLSDEDIATAEASVTAIRVENFPASARYRASRLTQTLLAYSPALELDQERSKMFWNEVRTLKMFQGKPNPLWRVSTIPSCAAKLIGNLSRKMEVRAVYDWSGGLIWIETPPLTDGGAVDIRRTLAEFGGHATLIRAEDATRAGIDVFQPLDPPIAALSAKLKHAFDPLGILNPGRMYRDM